MLDAWWIGNTAMETAQLGDGGKFTTSKDIEDTLKDENWKNSERQCKYFDIDFVG